MTASRDRSAPRGYGREVRWEPAVPRLPFMLVAGCVLVLVADARLLRLTADLLPDHVQVDTFGAALLATLVGAAASWRRPAGG